MRLIKKLGIFFKLKHNETFGVLFKGIYRNIKSIVNIILMISGLIGIFYTIGNLALYFKDSFVIDLLFILFAKDKELTITGMLFSPILILLGSTVFMVVILDLLIICFVIVVIALILIGIYTFFQWIRDNWKLAEQELVKKEIKATRGKYKDSLSTVNAFIKNKDVQHKSKIKSVKTRGKTNGF